ncbi:MAG: hypothetical protein ACXVCS_02165 [Bdellovibrionota bacterium]
MTNISLCALLVLAATPLIAGASGAEDKSYCYSLPDLASKVKDCQQNVFFVKAADACIAKLDSEIKSQQALLSAAMLLSGANATSAQSGRMANSSADLAQMQSTLQSLETEANTARAEIVNYAQNFTYAGPVSHEFAERFHMTRFLQKFPCFANSQSLLVDDVKQIDTQVASLDKARQNAAQMAKVNGVNIKSLDASSVNAAAHGRAPSSAAPARAVPTGTPKQSVSSITGTEKIDDSNRALQKLEAKP